MAVPVSLEMQAAMLSPCIALVLWSFVMLTWMYATRIPVILKMKLKYDPNLPNEAFTNKVRF